MIPSPLDAKYTVRVNVRPLRHAYFISADDAGCFAEVARFSCTQWGGIKNLIVPLRVGGVCSWIFEWALKLTEPDVFVSALSPEQTETQVVPLLSSLWPGREFKIIQWHHFVTADDAVHPLRILAPDDARTLIAYQFPDGPYHAQLVAAFGAIYPGQEALYSAKFQIERPSIETHDEGFWEAQHQCGIFDSVLNLTMREASAYRCRNPYQGNSFVIVLANSAESLCMYWCARAVLEASLVGRDPALGRRVLLITEEHLVGTTQLSMLADFLRVRLPVPGVSCNLQLYLLAWDKTGCESLRSAFLSIPGFKELDASKIETKIESDDSIVEDFSKEAITFAFQKPPFPTSFREGIGKGRDTTTVTLVEGHNSVPALMPSGLTLFGGSVAIDIETSVWDRYPKGPSLCQKILKQAWWSRYGVTVAKYSPEWYAQSVRFLLPGEWEALALHFEESGFEIRLSRGGRAAAALVNLIGGLDEMGVLASQSAHDLLKVLARLSRKKLAQRLVKSGIATSDAEACATSVPDGLMRETPSVCTLDDLKTKLGISGVHGFLELLGQLERRHIVRRGYYLACERCGSTSWYPMDSVRMQITCPGCDFAFPFPIEYPRGGGREVPWYYTLNTLVDAIMDQDGLPGLLSLYALTREYAAACLTSGLEVIKRGESQPRLELDFTLVVGGVLWAGECKAGAELVGDDIERAKQAIELGFKHFCFCTTVNFSEDAKNLIEGLRRETDGKVKIEVLEKDALFGGTRQRARGKLHD